jgi:DNA-binding XRE family transcriptional regulator
MSSGQVDEAKAFIDAVCRSCRKRFGWFGRIVDQPACPRCGRKPDRASLERDQAQMDGFRQLLAEAREANPNWERWREARLAAGLTLRQAAGMFDVSPSTLSAIEQGHYKPSEGLAATMARCYSGDSEEDQGECP